MPPKAMRASVTIPASTPMEMPAQTAEMSWSKRLDSLKSLKTRPLGIFGTITASTNSPSARSCFP